EDRGLGRAVPERLGDAAHLDQALAHWNTFAASTRRTARTLPTLATAQIPTIVPAPSARTPGESTTVRPAPETTPLPRKASAPPSPPPVSARNPAWTVTKLASSAPVAPIALNVASSRRCSVVSV